jgi:hypothetical protein
VGTTSPLTRLHFLGTGNASGTKLLVENASSPPAARELFEVKNNGDAAYIFKNSLEPERWYFGTFAHNFIIDNQANGGVEYFFGPAGNVIIAGTLTQSSDRATKTDINPVDSEAVLAKVSQLPIATWRRIGDDAVHLGPMAQDFHSAFGLGDDDRHIAPSDLASVSLTAVQGLLAEVKEQRQTIEKQQELIRKLEERLARLEKQ